ncbi:MAG: hypothetical protein GY859_05220, partial [Desulfobacterales bacterium]|nr:hypothetical protein [Desulfobacterales bacterium]
LVRLDLDAMREDRRWRAGEAGECFTMDVEGRWIGQGRKDGSVRLWKGEYDRSPRTFYNHGDYVTAIAIDVESKLLASGSLDGVIVIRKFNTRTILRKVNPLGGPIHDWEYSMDKDLVLNLAFSPNGKRLAAVYVNFGCCMFDSITGDLKWRIQDEEEPGFRTAVFHPDGKRVALGGNEGPMQIRSVETGELFSVKTGHQDAMNDVAFSADGKWCISGSSDGQVRPWRLTGRTVDQLERTEHGSRVCQLAFSPDGKLLASGNFHYPISVIAWDVETGLPIHVFPCPNITIKSVVIDLANRLLAAGSEGGDIWVWDLESERLVNEFSIQNKKVTRLFFDSTGQRLVSGAGGSEIQLWDLQKGAQLMKAECDYASRPVMQSRAPGFFLAFHNKGTLFLWNMRSGKEIKRFEPLDGHIQAAAFCPAGRFMAMGSSTGRVEIVDLKYGLKRRTLNDLGHSVGALAFNPDGSLLAAASCKMGFARVIAVEGQSVLGDLESAGTWWAYTERLENAANGEKTPPIESFRKEDYSFCSVGFSPDGKFVGLQLTDGGSILYALEDGRIEDMNPYRPVCGDFFSDPSETRWCLSGEKRESLVYDRSTRKKVAHYPGSFDHVIASPTDPAIFAAYKRGRIEIFSVQTS